MTVGEQEGIDRHRTIQNCLQAIAQKALGKTETHVEREPWIIRGKTDIYGKVIEGLRGDIGLYDFHPQKPKTIIDVRVFHPTSKSLQEEFVKHEREKFKKYNQECNNENIEFVPFVVTTDGALAPKAKSLLQRLTQTLATKWEVPEGVIRGWMKARIAMAIARASSACIRRNRKTPLGFDKELEVDFEDQAGVSRLLGLGQMGWVENMNESQTSQET